MNSVLQKLYRAKHHFEELDEVLRTYYRSEPGQLSKSGEGFEIGGGVPAAIGLIAGDALQCMRSSLDYLVWELVEANGGTPDRQNAFPISLSETYYKREVDGRQRLRGMRPEAATRIDLLQPYRLPAEQRKGSPLALLDELANINKHRRVLLTNLQTVILEEPLPFPHIASSLSALMPTGQSTPSSPTASLWRLTRALYLVAKSALP